MQPALMVVDGWRKVNGLGRFTLGQGPARVRVVVSDRKGEPFPGVPVVVATPAAGNVGEGRTDEDGVLIVQVPAGTNEVTVFANLPEGEIRERSLLSPLGPTIVSVRSVRRAPQPFLTPLELGFGVGGIALFILGTTTKLRPVEVVGEIAFIAALFTRVGRA